MRTWSISNYHHMYVYIDIKKSLGAVCIKTSSAFLRSRWMSAPSQPQRVKPAAQVVRISPYRPLSRTPTPPVAPSPPPVALKSAAAVIVSSSSSGSPAPSSPSWSPTRSPGAGVIFADRDVGAAALALALALEQQPSPKTTAASSREGEMGREAKPQPPVAARVRRDPRAAAQPNASANSNSALTSASNPMYIDFRFQLRRLLRRVVPFAESRKAHRVSSSGTLMFPLIS